MYEALVGAAWARLPSTVRAAHMPGVVCGTLCVERNPGLLARAIGWLMRLPAAGAAVPVRLRIEAEGDALAWRRSFGASTLTSVQRVHDGVLLESYGPFVVGFELRVRDGGLVYEQRRFGVRIGRRRAVWWPRWISPRIEARCDAPEGRAARVDVVIAVPLFGPLLRYGGELR